MSIELGRRLGDPPTSDSAANGGTWLTAAVRNAYVNKGLNKFWSDMLGSVKGDIQQFVNIFPELLSAATELTLSSGKFIISSGTPTTAKDMWRVWQGYLKTTLYQIKIYPEDMYSSLMSGENLDFVATARHPAVIQVAGTLQFFPQNSTFTPTIVYIKLPIDPSNGGLLTQGGTYDSPFGSQWNSQIAETAQKLFLIDHQKGG